MSQVFFRLRDDGSFPGRWFLRSPVLTDGTPVDARIFTYGIRYMGPANLVLGLRRPGVPMDFTMADFDVPVARSEIGGLFESFAGPAVQRIPVEIEGVGGGFEILNVLDVVECIDEEHSRIQRWLSSDERPEKVGQYRMITDLRVDAERARDGKIFRLAGWKIALVISDEVRRALLQLETTGVDFEAV